MSKINILSSEIYNRIAAGEVVERPFSVVKELVENSIDAGAGNITVEIEDGGKSFIRVTDDGNGIEKSELKKALLPHATSKILRVEDLENINTLGFRGEALASIASVSKITIISKPENEQLGASISAEGGIIGNVEDCGSPKGTEITVRNLFYNTPAREKFLKSAKSEESDISTYIARFILGNVNIAFKLISDGKTIYQSYGDGLDAAMICIYGSILDKCYYVNSEKNGIKIYGYIGKQDFTKPNRTYQTFFLNGRYISNQTVLSAIHNAYAAYLMKRQYPFFVLFAEIPLQAVDVNVHPNKTDVRFSNNQIVYGALYSVISKVLDGISDALDIVVDKREFTPQNNLDNTVEKKYDYATHNIKNDSKYSFGKISFADSGVSNALKKETIDDKKNSEQQNLDDIFVQNKLYIENLEKIKKEKEKEFQLSHSVKPEQEKIDYVSELKYIGQILNTYLIFDDGQAMYLADQHAAHERILFDKLMSQIESHAVDTQSLIIPYILDVNSQEYSFLLDKTDTLNQMGIEISEFGKNTYKISALPLCIAEMNIGKFFNELLSDPASLNKPEMKNLLKEKIAQKACKAAIKSGDTLRPQEIEVLTKALKADIGLKCPHGRPVAVRITRTEIDKWFKRIV